MNRLTRHRQRDAPRPGLRRPRRLHGHRSPARGRATIAGIGRWPSWPPARGERLVILSGADVTLPADESVDLFIVYNGTARIEGHASSIVVVNGTANLVGGRADSVIAIQSQVSVDPSLDRVAATSARSNPASPATAARSPAPSATSGSTCSSAGATWAALALIYVAFAVSALMAGVVLAGLAGRQVRAAGALITNEPVMVVGAAFVGLIAPADGGRSLRSSRSSASRSGIGLLGLVLPGLFVIGYIVTGIWFGELILGQSSPVVRERPYLAAVVGLTIVGLVSFLPPVGGLISFVGFGAVMLLSWRVLRGAPGAAPYAAGVGPVAEAAS